MAMSTELCSVDAVQLQAQQLRADLTAARVKAERLRTANAGLVAALGMAQALAAKLHV